MVVELRGSRASWLWPSLEMLHGFGHLVEEPVGTGHEAVEELVGFGHTVDELGATASAALASLDGC